MSYKALAVIPGKDDTQESVGWEKWNYQGWFPGFWDDQVEGKAKIVVELEEENLGLAMFKLRSGSRKELLGNECPLEPQKEVCAGSGERWEYHSSCRCAPAFVV